MNEKDVFFDKTHSAGFGIIIYFWNITNLFVLLSSTLIEHNKLRIVVIRECEKFDFVNSISKHNLEKWLLAKIWNKQQVL